MDLPEEHPVKFQPTAEKLQLTGLNSATDPEPLLNAHRNAVNHVDLLVGDLILDMHNKGMLTETVIIITGDHGDEFNDLKLGHWGHGSNFTKVQTSVPLLVIWPGRKLSDPGQFTSHYDIVPTMMEEMWKCKANPREYSFGGNMLEEKKTSWHLVGDGRELGILDFERGFITTLGPSSTYKVTDFMLNKLSRSKAREHNILDIIKDINRLFKIR
jgi:membrane-anchored protein YejM (alkaline phosphatase superfamily)